MVFSPAAMNKQPWNIKKMMQDVGKLCGLLPKGSTFHVMWDSGASISVSPHQNDFVSTFDSSCQAQPWSKGPAKGLSIRGSGHVAWSFHETNGVLRTLKVPAPHIPDCPVRLLSASGLLQTHLHEHLPGDAQHLMLSGDDQDLSCPPAVSLIDPRDNLPVTAGCLFSENVPTAMNAALSAAAEQNWNLSDLEKELLHWHCRLGHPSFASIQFLMRSGTLVHSAESR